MTAEIATRTWVFPFQPGQAVIHVAVMAMNRPYVLTPAVVVRVSGETVQRTSSIEHHSFGEWVTLTPLAGGKARRVNARWLAHAGFCWNCGQAAHLVEGALRCPCCGGPAEAVPPPDSWVGAHFPEFHESLPQRVRLLVLNPSLTAREVGDLHRRELQARARAYCEQHEIASAWQFGEDIGRQLSRAVDAADVETFGRIVAEVRERWARRTAALEWLFDQLDAREIAPPPLEPADDRTPDGEDDLTRWLQEQAERHERRKAA